MTSEQNEKPILSKPLRLWPGVALATLIVLGQYVVPKLKPDIGIYGLLASLVCTIGILIWWLFFSRARWKERLVAILVIAVGVLLFPFILHKSIINGAMGMLPYILVVPLLGVALVVWAAATKNVSSVGARSAFLVLAVFVTCGFWTLIRTGGFSGDGEHDFAWRWSKTAEERLLEQAALEPARPDVTAPVPTPAQQETSSEEKQTQPAEQEIAQAPAAAVETPEPAQPAAATEQYAQAEWGGFRGSNRDSIVDGVRIKTDWSASPPSELWRRKVGPGWSSFAVLGDLIFTQEQRGEEEVVACYSKKTGEPVWLHRDQTRFWESNAGAGPRGTPAIHNGRVYALGATGIINALNASDGTRVWSRNAASDTGAKLPGWGFSGSPLVVDDVVIVATSGQLIAYDVTAGKQRWKGPAGGMDYSSPHLAKLGGVDQVLFLSKPGVTSFIPATGKQLWQHPIPAATRIVQPAVMEGGDVIISEGDRHGMLRIAITNGSGKWNVQERWKSNGLKPYFNDFVTHKDYAYGFDGNMISAIDLKDGQRKWKGGKYGYGQLILLADQDLMLILSETGEVALVKAVPDGFTEVARFKAIEGKTWNHPVLVEDVLLVRNGEEMAAFQLVLEE